MTFLVIDTAFETCQAGLYRNNVFIAQKHVTSGGQHDRVLANMVDDLFKETNTTIKDIEKIIVTTGPGRFTGLRVGIAFARGLALVNQTPMTGVMTTDALARDFNLKYPNETNKAVIVCVKRGESFVQFLNPEPSAIVSVMDNDLSAYLEKQGNPMVVGVLSPALSALSLSVAEGMIEPSLESVAILGVLTPKSDIIRPYYAV